MFTISEFLQQEVKPALGCTEPGAVALAVAKACEQLPRPIEAVSIIVSDSIFKNGISVGIPGTAGLKGNVIAGALAVFAGKSAYGLEVLKDATDQDLAQAKNFEKEGRITLKANGQPGVYVEATAISQGHHATCIIKDSHSNITSVTKDGQTLYNAHTPNSTDPQETCPPSSICDQISQMNFDDLIVLADALSEDDIKYILNGVEMNLSIADFGFQNPDIGIGLARAIKAASGPIYEQDLAAQIKAVSTAASEARMGGVSMPVMSSAGSGNHGITAILPVYVVGKYYGKTDPQIAKSIAYSHLCTSYIKSRMGRLSPVCGCAIAAGAGASAGIVNILGGTHQQAIEAMNIVLGNLIGMLCDGAKESCALKVGTGATEAYYAAVTVLHGGGFKVSQGIVDINDFANTVINAARLNSEGMKNADNTVIDIISERISKN